MTASSVDHARRVKTLPPPQVARAIRTAAGVSQEQMASDLGVHRVTIARWEIGTRHPSGDLLVSYADLLDQLREVISR